MNDQKKFQRISKNTQISFILGIIAIGLTAIMFTIVTALQTDPWIAYTLYGTVIGFGSIGTIIGSVVLKDGRNVFSILGLVFNLFSVVFCLMAIIAIYILIQ